MMRLGTRARLLAVGVTAATLIGAGAGAASAAKAHPVTLAMLKSAPVPSLCEHPAGHLVNGSLPGIAENMGFVMIPAVTGEAHGNAAVVWGDLNGDGVRDAAVVVWCNRGGVGWPDSVQFYTSGAKRLGGISLEKISHGDRDYVLSMKLVRGVVTVHWSTNRDTDYGCCSTLDYAAQLHMAGHKFVVSHATPYDERPALHVLITAVKKHASLAHLATPFAAAALKSAQHAGQLAGTFHCYGAPGNDTTWPAALLYALGSSPDALSTYWDTPRSRFCVTSSSGNLVTMVRLHHVGYRRWQADDVVQGFVSDGGD